jgi:prepilin-type processing-associated H-X9-DG protein
MIRFNCPQCGMHVEVDDQYAGQSGPCPGCNQVITIPAVAAPTASMTGPTGASGPSGDAAGRPAADTMLPQKKTSGWAIASLCCGLLGCGLLPAILGIIFGIVGIRQVNRSQGRVGGMGLAIAGLVVSVVTALFAIPLLMAILLPNLAPALEQARRAQCAANLRGIGQAIHVYAAGNRGKWPTVYVGREDEAWREDWTADNTEISDGIANEGMTAEEMKDANYAYQCNLSCWWILIRMGISNPSVFVCPGGDQYADETLTDYSRFWSFQDLSHVSYSYQNQLGKGTTDNADAELIVAADASPLRGDLAGEPSIRHEDRAKTNRWELNSPNHDFEGQNCLYADGHVEWQSSPDCGIGGNNIWLRSVRDATTGTWTEDETSYEDPQSTVEDKRDSFLVP